MPENRLAVFFWRSLRRLNRRVVSRYGPDFRAAEMVLLLTTIGRKSGLPRTTPLQFEELDGLICVGASRGQHADWFRNLQAEPHVEVQIKGRRWRGLAEPVTDPSRIADFLQLRLQRRPLMIRLMLLGHGLLRLSRANLKKAAAGLAMAVIHPEETGDMP